MGFFSRPQEQKKSAKEEQARAGKRSMAEEKRSMFSLFKRVDKKEAPTQDTDVKDEHDVQEDIKTPGRERFGTASESIIRPRVTEKGSDAAQKSNAYVFDVMPGASKQQIAAGITELYGVEVKKVHTVPVKEKRIRDRRGRRGVKSGGKKAYVYLKRGDTIEFV